MTVIVTPPGRPAPSSSCAEVDRDLGATLQLAHGTQLTEAAAAAVLAGDLDRCIEELQLELVPPVERSEPERCLPPEGRWEYKVVPVTELGGFATARGTAERMQAALNSLAADGWELMTTSERDSHWVSGETVLLTLRRYVVPEHMFVARAMAEERLRRLAVAGLDQDDDQPADPPVSKS